MVNEIEKYLKDNLRKGVKLKDIKKGLSSSGYSAIDVNKAIRDLYRKQVINLAKYINNELKLGLKPPAIRNYLIAMGHSRSQVDEAMGKIVRAKKYLLRKKTEEKRIEQFKEIKNNIKNNLSKHFSKITELWNRLKPWQRGAFIPTAILFIILLFWEIMMMINSIILSGRLNCYSFGRIVTCSFFESLLFYLLLMLAFIIIFCLPVFGLGALVGYLIGRFRE